MYPDPKPTQPLDFVGFVKSHIIPEVRAENLRYYGPSECLESQYPGLDYSNKNHRLRLGQFHYHRKLFLAFDALRLTRQEINTICTWEGTRAAKRKYEAESGSVIKDTTFDEIQVAPRRLPTVTHHPLPPWPDWKPNYMLPAAPYGRHRSPKYVPDPRRLPKKRPKEDTPKSDESSGQESSDDIISNSVGVSLNQRLVEASERRYRGEQAVMDPAWEQWMKDAAERGSIPPISTLGSHSRLASFQAHIAAHCPYATPIYHYGPHSPAPPTFTPSASYNPQPTQSQPPRPREGFSQERDPDHYRVPVITNRRPRRHSVYTVR
jgi:hypothetical protein